MKHKLLIVLALLSATACSKEPDPRGVDRRETLLQVSANGQADTRPDEARFTVGVSTIEGSADAASASNNRGIERVVNAVQAVGVKADDIQTRNISLSKID